MRGSHHDEAPKGCSCRKVASCTNLLLVDVHCNVQQFHCLPLLHILGTNSNSEVEKTLYRGSDPVTITGRSNAIISKSSFTSLALLISQASPSCGPYGLFSHKSTAKPSLNPKSPALAAKRAVDQISDDLCSSALRQQRSNLVNQSVARFYLLVSEVVLGTVL